MVIWLAASPCYTWADQCTVWGWWSDWQLVPAVAGSGRALQPWQPQICCTWTQNLISQLLAVKVCTSVKAIRYGIQCCNCQHPIRSFRQSCAVVDADQNSTENPDQAGTEFCNRIWQWIWANQDRFWALLRILLTFFKSYSRTKILKIKNFYKNVKS